MSNNENAIAEFIGNLEIFEQLPENAIADLATKLQPLRYRMGQIIVKREKIAPYVAILYEGKARLIGYDPRNQMPVTLKLLESGAAIGNMNLVRGVACETAIASTEVICLTLSNTEFLQLLQQYPQLQEKIARQSAIVEVFDLLGYQLEQQAIGDGNLKELSTKLLPTAQIYNLPTGKNDLGLDHPSLGDPNWVWLFSGGGSVVNCPPGTRLEPDKQNIISVSGSEPARLIGFPQAQWSAIANNSLGTKDVVPQIHLKKEQPTIASESDIIPYATVELLDKETTTETKPTDTETKKNYPYIRGKTPLDAGAACFQMLSQYFKMPFRKDVIRRVLNDQLQRTGTLSLPTCGGVAELMGLNAQLVTVPSTAITRLHTPFVVNWQQSLAIIYEISDRSIVIAVPEIGILRRKPEDFLDTWGTEGEVLLLKSTKETPQERFGLSWFLPYLSRYRRVLIEVFIASFFFQLFALGNPLMFRVVIDKAIGQRSVETLNVFCIFMLVLAVFEASLGALRTYLFVDTTNRIDMSLGSRIIDHLLRLPLRYFERRPVGEISTRINELENIRQFLTGTALTVVLDVIFSFVYIVVMLIMSPLMTFVTLSVVPVLIIITALFSPTIRKKLRTKAERNAQTQSYLVEVLSGIQTVKAQNIELRSRWQWQERYARYVSAGFQTVITQTLASSTSNLLNKISGVILLWVGGYLMLDGQITFGTFFAFRILSGYVTSPILRLAQLWQNFQETALSLERLSDIVDNPQEGEQDKDNIPMPTIVGSVKYENVSFRFKNTGPLQLYNVNLEFAPGTFVAIVGQSGAGKSTVTKLISRLYEPESGRILVDGFDINKVELYSLRSQVGVVPQDPLLFDGTVQENIALTNPDASTEEVIEAARIAVAHEFIMNLPNGYNTRVGERGSGLSGGQRQRIAIARTVLQNPRMIVLDEATSALDYTTEQQVCLNLKGAFGDRSVFFITHRLGTIRGADVIVMMDSGSVVEEGTHDKLMALKGRYYYLYRQQEAAV